MPAEAGTPRRYVPGRGGFLIVLGCVGFVGGLIKLGSPDTWPPGTVGAALGNALPGCVLPALVGLFTFRGRNPARSLGERVLAPALLYGLLEGLEAGGRAVGDRLDPVDALPAIAGAAVIYAGALVGLLYLLQFVQRLGSGESTPRDPTVGA